MKPIYTAVLFATLAVPGAALGGALHLTEVSAAQDGGGPAGRTPDQVLDMMASKLNLSEDQKAQIKPIIADRQQQLAALRGDTSMRPRKKKQKLQSILEESDKKINAVLNDDQKKQYAELEQQMREQMKDRMQNRNGSN